MYLQEITEVVNRTGNIAALEAEAGRIARSHGMIRSYVLDDLKRMRRIVVSEAVQAVKPTGFND